MGVVEPLATWLPNDPHDWLGYVAAVIPKGADPDSPDVIVGEIVGYQANPTVIVKDARGVKHFWPARFVTSASVAQCTRFRVEARTRGIVAQHTQRLAGAERLAEAVNNYELPQRANKVASAALDLARGVNELVDDVQAAQACADRQYEQFTRQQAFAVSAHAVPRVQRAFVEGVVQRAQDLQGKPGRDTTTRIVDALITAGLISITSQDQNNAPTDPVESNGEVSR